MKADVLLYPQALSNQVFNEKKVVVIDVLRATSTIVTALSRQALQVIPVNEPTEAIELARRIGSDECVLGGEQKGLKIEGFDLGNSPTEYDTAKVAEKKVILCTTNGTKAIKRAQGAAEVLIGSYLNMQAIVDYLATSGQDLLVLCAGRELQVSLEDLACAGMVVRDLKELRDDLELTDAATVARYVAERAQSCGLEQFFALTEHGQYLTQIGMAADLQACAALNQFTIVPRFTDGKIVG
jgi:2-phosphosulfolactate phosphatase